MPKRIIDGEGIWTSNKLRQVPEEWRFHYAVWLPLAEANGVFEANPDVIWHRVYSLLSPKTTPETVAQILKAFVDAGLLYVWSEGGRNWAYFIGIEKPGRLPSKTHVKRYSALPPSPPSGILSGTPSGTCLGLGLGLGLGNGLNPYVDPKPGSTDLFGNPDQTAEERKAEVESKAIKWVFDYYVKTLNRNPKTYTLTTEKEKLLRVRLHDFTAITKDLDAAVNLMARCIDAITTSDYHMGRDKSTKGRAFNELDNIFGKERYQQWLTLIERVEAKNE